MNNNGRLHNKSFGNEKNVDDINGFAIIEISGNYEIDAKKTNLSWLWGSLISETGFL
jgi:hypothetical protein